MKILMLFPYAPLPPPLDLAGSKRNLPFLLELVKYNEVSVLTYGTDEDEILFRRSYADRCADIRFVNRKRPRIVNAAERFWLLGTGRSSFRSHYRAAMQRAISDMTARRSYDLIHCCVPFFGYFAFPAGIPVTSDTHEVTYDLLARTAATTKNLFWKLIAFLSSRLGKQEELALCRKFQLLITTTARDEEIFRGGLPHQKIVVIQNGAGDSFFEDLGVKPEPCTIVFTGLFTHPPNSQGILYFLKHIFPRILAKIPNARVYIVGKSPTREMLSYASEHVIVTGFVEDVRPFMARSEVFIIPLQAGGGIRGKALEAMAMKRPIVTTTIGVEGIHLRHEESALFADSSESFADATIRLLHDDALRRRLAENAFATVVRQYNWEAKGKELHQALAYALAAHSNAPRSTPLREVPHDELLSRE